MILTKKIDDNQYEVTVKEKTTTTHTVTINDEYYQKLTGGKISKEELLKKSFEFLLQRESNTMIYSSFELPVIETYFPEYTAEIRKTF